MEFDQLKNEVKRTASAALLVAAGALAAAGCGEQNSKNNDTADLQQYIRVGERGLVVPINPATGQPKAIPREAGEVVDQRKYLPSAKPHEECFSEDASPIKNGLQKAPRTITTQTDTFNDSYEIDYRHIAGNLAEGYIQIIQEPENNNGYPWMRIVPLNPLEKIKTGGYVELPDSKPNTTVGMLVEAPQNQDHWAQVTVQVCTPTSSIPEGLENKPTPRPEPTPDDQAPSSQA